MYTLIQKGVTPPSPLECILEFIVLKEQNIAQQFPLQCHRIERINILFWQLSKQLSMSGMLILRRRKCMEYAKCLIYMFEFEELLKHFYRDCKINGRLERVNEDNWKSFGKVESISWKKFIMGTISTTYKVIDILLSNEQIKIS